MDKNKKLLQELADKLKVEISFKEEQKEAPKKEDINLLQKQIDNLKAIINQTKTRVTNSLITALYGYELIFEDCLYLETDEIEFLLNEEKIKDKKLIPFIEDQYIWDDFRRYFQDEMTDLLFKTKDYKRIKNLIDNINETIKDIENKYVNIHILDYVK